MARRVGAGFGIGALLIIIVVAMVVLPMLLTRFKMRAGFVDIGESITVPTPSSEVVRQRGSAFLPCRGTGNNPCPEGTFCDGSSGGCVPIAMAGV
jgi:hypothetical protein